MLLEIVSGLERHQAGIPGRVGPRNGIPAGFGLTADDFPARFADRMVSHSVQYVEHGRLASSGPSREDVKISVSHTGVAVFVNHIDSSRFAASRRTATNSRTVNAISDEPP